MTIYTDPSGRVWRTVSPALANAVLSMIGPDFSMEAAMRLLYPEEASYIYDPGRWPWGAPL